MTSPADSLFTHDSIAMIAAAHSKTPAQVLLRWGLQSGTSVIPKTSKAERLAENLDVFDFSLSDNEMESIATLDRNQRFNDPGVFCEFMGKFHPIYD